MGVPERPAGRAALWQGSLQDVVGAAGIIHCFDRQRLEQVCREGPSAGFPSPELLKARCSTGPCCQVCLPLAKGWPVGYWHALISQTRRPIPRFSTNCSPVSAPVE